MSLRTNSNVEYGWLLSHFDMEGMVPQTSEDKSCPYVSVLLLFVLIKTRSGTTQAVGDDGISLGGASVETLDEFPSPTERQALQKQKEIVDKLVRPSVSSCLKELASHEGHHQ